MPCTHQITAPGSWLSWWYSSKPAQEGQTTNSKQTKCWKGNEVKPWSRELVWQSTADIWGKEWEDRAVSRLRNVLDPSLWIWNDLRHRRRHKLKAATMKERRLVISQGKDTWIPYWQALFSDGTLAFILFLKNNGQTWLLGANWVPSILIPFFISA